MRFILKYTILFLLSISVHHSFAQYIGEVIEYKPAPGQFINESSFGTPEAAESLIGGTSGLVSLGAYGGYMIVKMDQSIENHPDNPFGMDFTILGNALPDWCEAGIVEVMKDENNNGLADDTWYILAGSDYYLNHNETDYTVTYFNPHQEQAADVLWVDHHNDSGYVYKNNFHSQVYYPLAENFPEIDQDSYSLNGMRVIGNVDKTNPSYVRSYSRYFGYADNKMRGSSPWDIPDNPYTEEKENAGGDAMDISWARDAQGNRVELDKIDFIKVYNAMNESAGGLGEISTEISGIIDVSPNTNMNGETRLIAAGDHPYQLSLSSNYQMEVIFFESGIPATNQNLIWNSSNTSIATINSNGLIETHLSGETTISVYENSASDLTYSFELLVAEPSSVEILIQSTTIHADEFISIGQIILDQNNEEISGIDMEWSSSNTDVLEISNINDDFFMEGMQEGSAWLYAQLKDFADIKDSIEITVLPAAESLKINIAVQTENTNIFPRQSVNVEHFDLTPFVKDTEQDYGLGSVSKLTLAHAIAALFDSHQLSDDLRFKDDEINNNQLYLWKLPHEEGSALNYFYGFGGNNQDESHSRSWLVKLNDQTFARNFHQIEIKNDDEILIYHIEDSRNPWEVNQLVLSEDTATAYTEIQAHYTKENCKFFSDGVVELLGSEAIIAAALMINNEELIYEDQVVTTNSNGQANFKVLQQGNHIISIGNEKVQLIIDNATSVQELNQRSFTIYPNPTKESFHIISSVNSEIDIIQIFNSQGQKVFETTEQRNINIESLPSGYYICHLVIDGQIITKSLVKN